MASKCRKQSRTRRAQRKAAKGHGPSGRPAFRQPTVELLEDRRLLASAWQNPYVAGDVTGEGVVAPLDALVAINELNARSLIDQFGALADRSGYLDHPFYDTSGDAHLTAADVLLIINAINGDYRGPNVSVGLARDTAPDGTTNQDGITSDATISGRIIDDLTGVSSLSVQVDSGLAQAVTVQRDGTFLFVPALDDSQQGEHRFEFTARDGRANASEIAELVFTLDTRPPGVVIESQTSGLSTDLNLLVEGYVIEAGELAGFRGRVDQGLWLDLDTDAGRRFSFPTALPLDGSADGVHRVCLDAADTAGNVLAPASDGTCVGVSFVLNAATSGGVVVASSRETDIVPPYQRVAASSDAVFSGEFMVRLADGVSSSGLAASYNATHQLQYDSDHNVNLWSIPPAISDVEWAQRLESDPRVLEAFPVYYGLAVVDRYPDDPLVVAQWHLANSGQAHGLVGLDANVLSAWEQGITGRGVTIGIADEGIQSTHQDLAPHYDPVASYDFHALDDNADPAVGDGDCDGTAECHGTSVAGVAAAVGNSGLGVAGVAPNAVLGSLKVLGSGSFYYNRLADALRWSTTRPDGGLGGFDAQRVDIYNNSYRITTPGQAVPPNASLVTAINESALQGRGGLGSVYVWSAGNDRAVARGQSDVNYRAGYSNNRHVIPVAAVSDSGLVSSYSNPGAPLLVSAPSNGNGGDGITTTDLQGAVGYNLTDFDDEFGGTSSAAPLVSGVVALMMEANPALTNRDVQHILVQSAAQDGLTTSSFALNQGGRAFSHDYGFGVVNAEGAVNLASNWRSVGPELLVDTGNMVVPSSAIADGGTVSSSVAVAPNLRVENIEVILTATHPRRGDLTVTLEHVGSTNSISTLARTRASDNNANYAGYIFETRAHWDELSAGEWRLSVTDGSVNSIMGSFDSWRLRIYGTSATPDTVGARVTTAEVPPNQLRTGSVRQFQVQFNEPIIPSSFTTSDVSLTRVGGGTAGITGVTPVPGAGNRVFDVTFSEQSAAGNYRIDIGPDIVDAAGNLLDQDGDANNGESSQDRYTDFFTIGTELVFSNSTPGSLRDDGMPGDPLVRSLALPAVNVADVKLLFNLWHNVPSYTLDISLTAPGATSAPGDDVIRVVADNNALNTNSRPDNGYRDTVLSDDDPAAPRIDAATSTSGHYTGHYRPSNSLTAFSGSHVAGNWTLMIDDVVAGGGSSPTGYFRDFSLILTPAGMFDISLDSVTNVDNDRDQVEVTYSIRDPAGGNGSAPPFDLVAFDSDDTFLNINSDVRTGAFRVTDTSCTDVAVGCLTGGPHTLNLNANLFPAPTDSRGRGLYSLLVADPQQEVLDASRANNRQVLQGATITPGGTLYIAGSPFQPNTIAVSGIGINFNGTMIGHDVATVTDIVLMGGSEPDTIVASGVSKPISAFLGVGNDHYTGGNGGDVVDAGPGHDWIVAGNGDDVLRGGIGADQIWAGSGNDQLWGEQGDDQLDGGPGDDTFHFAEGFGSDRLTGAANDGIDTVDFAGVMSSLTATMTTANLTVTGGAQASGTMSLTHAGSAIERVIGGEGDDNFDVSAIPAAGLWLDGADGGDQYTWSGAALGGLLTIADSGTSGVDGAVVNGTTANETFVVSVQGIVRGDEHIALNANVEQLVVQGLGGDDSFDVEFPGNLSVTIDGGTHVNGDSLNFNPLGFQATHNPGDKTITGPDFATLHYLNMETVNFGKPNVWLTLLNPTEVAEDGTGNLVYRISRDGSTDYPLPVSFSTSGSGADANDYSLTGGGVTYNSGTSAGMVIIPAGSLWADVTIDPTPDGASEPHETVRMTLVATDAYTIPNPNPRTGVIQNDDGELTMFSDLAIAEGDAGTTNLDFTVVLRQASVLPVSVSYATADGTAVAGSDYVASAGALTFQPGETRKTITIGVLGDTLVEPDEVFTVTLSNPVGAILDAATARGTIRNDDGSLAIAALDSAKREGDTGTTAFTFEVTRAGSGSASVAYAVVGAGANAADASDFAGGQFPSGSVTFSSTEQKKTITVTVRGDADLEADEDFIVQLSNAVGATLGTAEAGGTILNDDSVVSIRSADGEAVDKPEGNTGETAFTFTVVRAGFTGTQASVSYTVAGSGTHPADSADFGDGQFVSGSVTLSNGEAQRDVTIFVRGDAAIEPDEGFTVTLANPIGAGLGVSTASRTILNDDNALEVVPTTLTINEGTEQSFTVRLATRPITDVAVTTTRSSGDTDLTVSAGASLQFTRDNWSSPQTVHIAAAEDADTMHGSATFAVSAPGFTSLAVTATEVDNDSATLTGGKFEDLDADGIRDQDEPGVAGWPIYLDLNRSGRRETGEPLVLTDSQGGFAFDLMAAGTYVVSEQVQANWRQSAPRAVTFAQDTFGVRDPRAAVFGDFDKDLDPDLVISNSTDHTLVLLTNDGFGNFTLTGSLPVGRNPSHVVAVDLNNDKNLDLAVTNWTSNSVSVLLGDGRGQFAAAVDYLVGRRPFALAAADLDGDGFPDLATTDAHGDTVSLLLNQRDGTFRANGTLPAGDNPTSVTPADLNADGRLDLIVSNTSFYSCTPDIPWCDPNATREVRIYLNQGPAGFVPQPSIPAPGRTMLYATAVGDVNGDNWPDLAVANNTLGHVTIHLGRGDGTFGGPVTVTVGGGPERVLLEDMNGDGALDIVTSNSTTDNVSIALGSGRGTFGPATHFPVGDFPRHMAVEDVNGDGRPDLVVPNQRSNDVMLLRNFTGSHVVNFSSGQQSVANLDFGNYRSANVAGQVFADDDADGTQDTGEPGLAGRVVYLDSNLTGQRETGEPTAVTDAAGNYAFADLDAGTYVVAEQLLAGWKQSAPQQVALAQDTLPIADPRDAVLADIDADGDRDLVLSSSAEHRLYVYRNDGRGTFALADVLPVARNPMYIIAAHLNNDAHLDLAVANWIDNAVSVLLGQGRGTFAPFVAYPVGQRPYGLAAADFDGDTYIDLATANTYSDDVTILTNRKDGTFQAGPTLPGGDYPVSLSAADVDGDGKQDLMVANISYSSNACATIPQCTPNAARQVRIYYNQGGAVFDAPMFLALPNGASPYAVAPGDVNGDGLTDLAVAINSTTKATIHLGLGGRRFAAPTEVTIGRGPVAVALVDMNGDGHTDLVSGNSVTDDVSVALGFGNGTFAAAVHYPVGDFPIHMAVGDVNDDQRPDLVIPNKSSGTWMLLRNFTGAHVVSLNPAQQADLDFGTYRTASIAGTSFRDDDADGVQDAGEPALAGWEVYLDTNRNGRFDLREPLAVTDAAGGYEFGNLDVGTYAVSERLLAGFEPTFPQLVSFTQDTLLVTDPRAAVLARIDEDNDLDLIVSSSSGNRLLVYRNDGTGKFTLTDTLPVGRSPMHVIAAHLNDDPHLDLAVANWSGDSVSVLLGQGQGVFAPAVDYAVGRRPFSLVAADLDGDTHIDLATANNYSDDVTILLNRADGTFQAGPALPAGDNPTSVTAADLDHDGKQDLMVANISYLTNTCLTHPECEPNAAKRVRVYYGQGGGIFEAPVFLTLPGGASPYAVAHGDVNGDGLTDLAVAINSTTKATVHLGTSARSFGAATEITIGRGPEFVALADMNGDQRLDLVSSNSVTDDVSVALGLGNGAFAAAVQFPVGDFPRHMAVGDVNGDDRPDLVVPNQLSDTSSVLRNFVGSHVVTLAPGVQVEGVLFGNRPLSSGAALRVQQAALPPLTPQGDLDEYLERGVRRLPSADDVDLLFARQQDWLTR